MEYLMVDSLDINEAKNLIKSFKDLISKNSIVLLNFTTYNLFNLSERNFLEMEKQNPIFNEKNLEQIFKINTKLIVSEVIKYIFLIDKFLILNYLDELKNNIPTKIQEIISEYKNLIMQLNKYLEYINFIKTEHKSYPIFKIITKENFKIEDITYLKNFLDNYFNKISILNNIDETLSDKLFLLKNNMLKIVD